jgi:Zn-dependent protease with chaperone function
VERWPTELPLYCAVIFSALMIWGVLTISVFGVLYAAFLGIFFFFSHLVFVTYLRGSAVKLGPTQFPELYARVAELSRRAGMESPPETYIQSAGGALNAFATKFFRSRIVVLYSDLLEACGDDLAARDMVIGHELGHHKSGHLRFHWLLLPGLMLPFLGSAYSRAREYTCDRFGKALCHDRQGAVRGLAVLAAGKDLGPHVDLTAFVEQSRDLTSSWMTLGRWLSFYPQLCERVDALERDLSHAPIRAPRGAVGALVILAALVVIPTGAIVLGMAALAAAGGALAGLSDLEEALEADEFGGLADDFIAPDPQQGTLAVGQHFDSFAAHLRALREQGAELPADTDELYESWERINSTEPPLDPFDGLQYGVTREGLEFRIWSSGPDGEPGTADDLERVIELGS